MNNVEIAIRKAITELMTESKTANLPSIEDIQEYLVGSWISDPIKPLVDKERIQIVLDEMRLE